MGMSKVVRGGFTETRGPFHQPAESLGSHFATFPLAVIQNASVCF